MNKILLFVAVFSLVLFGLFLYNNNWDLSQALGGIGTSLQPVADLGRQQVDKFTTLFKEDPMSGIAAIGAGAGTVGAVAYPLYRMYTDRKNREMQNLVAVSTTEHQLHLDSEAKLIAKINDYEAQIKNLQSKLEGNIDYAEFQKEIGMKDTEIQRLRDGMDALNKAISNMKVEQVVEKVVVK
jgi:hypothetical protein